jgi:hypothetical protein
MIRVRKIFAYWTKKDVSTLANFDITISEGYDSFFIDEGELYEQVLEELKKEDRSFLRLTKKKEISDSLASARFSKKEIKDASCYSLGFQNIGYPQPEINFDYRNRIFKVNCSITKEGGCGYSDQQKDSYYIKKEPKFNSKNLLFSLHWEPDKVFVQKEFYDSFFKPRGYKYRPVFKKLGKERLETVVQLEIPICESAMDFENSWYKTTAETYAAYGRFRYSVKTGDYLPPFKAPVNQEFFMSQELFDTGGSTFRHIVTTKDFFDELSEFFKYPSHGLVPSKN